MIRSAVHTRLIIPGFSLPLFLRGNDGLGLESGVGLSDVLSLNSPLCCLDLALNPLLGCLGAQCLSKGLRENCTLTELRLEGSGIGAEGLRALAEALGASRALRR